MGEGKGGFKGPRGSTSELWVKYKMNLKWFYPVRLLTAACKNHMQEHAPQTRHSKPLRLLRKTREQKLETPDLGNTFCLQRFAPPCCPFLLTPRLSFLQRARSILFLACASPGSPKWLTSPSQARGTLRDFAGGQPYAQIEHGQPEVESSQVELGPSPPSTLILDPLVHQKIQDFAEQQGEVSRHSCEPELGKCFQGNEHRRAVRYTAGNRTIERRRLTQTKRSRHFRFDTHVVKR